MDLSLFFSNLEMIDVDVFWDFPDLPREAFYRIVGDSNQDSKVSKKDIAIFKEKLTELNGRTDVISQKKHLFYNI